MPTKNKWCLSLFKQKLAQLVQEIPWGQNIVIMQKIKSMDIREYYLTATSKYGWSRDVLTHQIEAEAHKRDNIKRLHNFNKTLPANLAEQADLAIKDSYLLDFLDVAEPSKNRDRIEVEYTLRGVHTPIGVSGYELTRALPEKLKSSLPTVEEIEKELAKETVVKE